MNKMKAKEKKERPGKAKYRTPEELKAKVDEYFLQCQGKEVIDPRTGKVKKVGAKPPSLTGLSYFLGYRMRDTFRRQAFRNEQFAEVVAYAKMRCEMYAEERLFDKSGYNGAAFILRYSYGWDRQDVDPEEYPITEQAEGTTDGVYLKPGQCLEIYPPARKHAGKGDHLLYFQGT